MANSDYPNHLMLASDLQAYLRWRNANNGLPDVLAANAESAPRSAANAANPGATAQNPSLCG